MTTTFVLVALLAACCMGALKTCTSTNCTLGCAEDLTVQGECKGNGRSSSKYLCHDDDKNVSIMSFPNDDCSGSPKATNYVDGSVCVPYSQGSFIITCDIPTRIPGAAPDSSAADGCLTVAISIAVAAFVCVLL